MNKKNFDLSIVIPAYREEKRISKTLDSLIHLLREPYFTKLAVEIIVVSADSNDKTHEIVEKYPEVRLIKAGPKLGKGRDVKLGILASTGKAVMFMDADLATPLKYVKKFYDAFLGGSEIVIAVRPLQRYRSNILRIIASESGNILYKIMGGIWIEDSQCGFKLFSKNAAKICFSNLKIQGWGFDMEILTIAKANKIPINKIRVEDWKNVGHGSFEDNLIENYLVSLRDLFFILYRRMSGEYKLNS
jgi:dolichyl-phosphate beta-glucosyltransferase